VILKLAKYIKSMEGVPSRNHVVRGIELMNEPDIDHSSNVRALYRSMVPQVRNILPATRYAILLSFMDSPHESGPWLGKQIAQGDQHVWFNVLYDKHLYHAYGDDDGVTPWTRQMDSCKTCCRDAANLKSLGSVPFVVGEWSLTTGTMNRQEHDDPGFLRSFWGEQLSLWKTAGALGSFFWLHKLIARSGQPDYFLPFNLLRLINGPVKLPKPDTLDLSTLCAGHDLSKCPAFDSYSMSGYENCIWNDKQWV